MINIMIPPMNFINIQSAVASLLANEIANQKSIFLADTDNTEKMFNNDYQFFVSDGLYYPKDIGELPLVNVYFEKTEMIANDSDDMALIPHVLHIDCYVYRADAEQEDGTVIDGSSGADRRLNYLLSQTYHMMEAQINPWLNSFDWIDNFTYMGFDKLDSRRARTRGENTVVPIAMGSHTFSIVCQQQKLINAGNDFEGFNISFELDNKAAQEFLIIGE